MQSRIITISHKTKLLDEGSYAAEASEAWRLIREKLNRGKKVAIVANLGSPFFVHLSHYAFADETKEENFRLLPISTSLKDGSGKMRLDLIKTMDEELSDVARHLGSGWEVISLAKQKRFNIRANDKSWYSKKPLHIQKFNSNKIVLKLLPMVPFRLQTYWWGVGSILFLTLMLGLLSIAFPPLGLVLASALGIVGVSMAVSTASIALGAALVAAFAVVGFSILAGAEALIHFLIGIPKNAESVRLSPDDYMQEQLRLMSKEVVESWPEHLKSAYQEQSDTSSYSAQLKPLMGEARTITKAKKKDVKKEALSIAEKRFIKGHIKNKVIKEKAKTDRVLAKKFDTKKKSSFLFVEDKLFKRAVTCIPHTNFITCPGPKWKDVPDFLCDMATGNVQEIVAFGECLSLKRETKQDDFYDYCVTPRTIARYGLKIEKVSGYAGTDFQGRTYPDCFTRSKLTIEQEGKNEQVVHVTVFGLKDNESLQLKGDRAEEKKEMIWQIFQKSLKEKIAVHCRAGIGRTGHFILMLEILKHYQTIFSGSNPEIIADKILALVDNMRQVKPGLVWTTGQFIQAIENAHILYQYGLSKGHVQAKTMPPGEISDVYVSPLRAQRAK